MSLAINLLGQILIVVVWFKLFPEQASGRVKGIGSLGMWEKNWQDSIPGDSPKCVCCAKERENWNEGGWNLWCRGSSGKAKGLIDFASTPENASRSEPQVGAADPRPEVGPKFTGAGRQAAGEAGDKFIGIGTMLQNIFACMRTRLDSTLQQIDKQAAVSQAATTFRDCRGRAPLYRPHPQHSGFGWLKSTRKPTRRLQCAGLLEL